MAAKKKRTRKKPSKGLNIKARQAEPEPVYTAVQKKSYHNFDFGMTPAHPAMREYHFPRNMDPAALRKRVQKDKAGLPPEQAYFQVLIESVAMQGTNRRRIALEQEIAGRIRLYNDLVLRMNEQLGKSLDQLVLPYSRPRTHLEQYDDIKSITEFLTSYWEIMIDGKPAQREQLRARIEEAYRAGEQMAEHSFEQEYQGPGYGEEFASQTRKLLRAAEKERKAGRLK